jgi:hypothetical protein
MNGDPSDKESVETGCVQTQAYEDERSHGNERDRQP